MVSHPRTSWDAIKNMIMLNVNIFDPELKDNKEYIEYMKDTPMLREAFEFAWRTHALNSLKGILDIVDDWENPVYQNIYYRCLSMSSVEQIMDILEIFIEHPKKCMKDIKSMYEIYKDSIRPHLVEKINKLIEEYEMPPAVNAVVPDKSRPIYEEIIEAEKKDADTRDELYFNYMIVKKEFKEKINGLTAHELLNLLKNLYESKNRYLTSRIIAVIAPFLRENIEKYSDIKIDILKLYIYDNIHTGPRNWLWYFNINIIAISLYKCTEIIELFEKIIQDTTIDVHILQKILSGVEDLKTYYQNEFTKEMYYKLKIEILERMKELK